MSSASKTSSAISKDRSTTKAHNTLTEPGSQAIKGAVLAFATSQSRQPTSQNATGARAAAIAAGFGAHSRPARSPVISPPSFGSEDSSTRSHNVRERVQNIERSKTRRDVGQTQQFQPTSRPLLLDSQSQAAAKLASTNAARRHRLASTSGTRRTSPSVSNDHSTAAADLVADSPASLAAKGHGSYSPNFPAPESAGLDHDNLLVRSMSPSYTPPKAIKAMVASKSTQNLSPSRVSSSVVSSSPSPASHDRPMKEETSPSQAGQQSRGPPPKPVPLQLRHSSNTSHNMPKSRSNSAPRKAPRYSHDSLTVNTLADAMMASSLASSRAPSPTKTIAPPPLHRRQSRSRNFFHHHDRPSNSGPSRTGSPSQPGASGMRQTLRTQPKSDDEAEDTRGRRRHFVRKHPNKHHEGDRRRWRDEITDRERRRYEGVWAANKALFVSPADVTPRGDIEAISGYIDNADRVLNLVVRELWQRSRLSEPLLEEIWDLVTIDEGVGGEGSLGKEEFVVGMWLIDQSLKGRKLPIRVSQSVWNSARRTLSIQLRRGEG